MHRPIKFLMTTLLTGMLICMVAACAKPYFLSVGYHLPEEPEQLAGQKVSLVVEDRRQAVEELLEGRSAQLDRG